MNEEKKSYITIENKTQAYFLILGGVLMSVFTIGLLYPVANWLLNRYFIARKYIDDRQLIYKGKLWMCFIIIYIGLALLFTSLYFIQVALNHYNLTQSIPHQLLNAIPGALGSLFINIWINKYTQMSTHFVDETNKKSNFEFHIWLFLGKYILTEAVKLISIGLLYPFSTRMSALYDYKRGYIDGYHFSYRFSIKKMYPRYLLDLLLTIITLGIYFPLLYIRRIKIDQEFVHIVKE